MKKIFTLIASVLLVSSMNVMSKDINVTVENNLKTVIEDEAASGDVIILADGEYNVESSINLTKDITIKAASEGKAVLSKYQFVVPGGPTIGNIEFDGCVFKHDPTIDSKYFFQINTATSLVTNLTLKNCHIFGYGRGVIRGTTSGAKLDNLIIENCIFEENSIMGAGYAHINTQKVDSKVIKITNSTFYKSKAAIFRYEGTTDLNFLFENCTVINCGSSEGRTIMEVGSGVTEASVFKVKNCIFTGSYDTTIPTNKPIDFRDKGDVENSLLEGYSTVLINRVTETSPLSGTVTSFNLETFTIATNPSSILGIGDSRWVLNDISNSIDQVDIQKNIISTQYFDLMGRKVTETTRGLIIVKNLYEDGSVSTQKVINK